jgi:hypothetical protein
VNLTNGLWQFATGYSPRHADRLVARLRKWKDTVGSGRVPLIIAAAMADDLGPLPKYLDIVALQPETASETVAANTMASAFYMRRGVIPDDWDFLSLSPLEVPRHLQVTLTVAAQIVLRKFASRLPGFGATNLRHLNRNFLCANAVIEAEEDRSVIKLSRVPLDIILSVSGASRSTIKISWLDDRPFQLFTQE